MGINHPFRISIKENIIPSYNSQTIGFSSKHTCHIQYYRLRTWSEQTAGVSCMKGRQQKAGKNLQD